MASTPMESAGLSDSKLNDMFDSIDLDGDGFLTPEEVALGASHLFFGLPARASKAAVQDFFKRFDANHDGRISRKEFANAIRTEEAKLWEIYRNLSAASGSDGIWDRRTVVSTFKSHFADPVELERFVEHAMDVSMKAKAADGVALTFAEFEQWMSLNLYRLERLSDVLDEFRAIDCGHDAHVESVNNLKATDKMKTLGIATAGLLAGLASRTATAPAERLKVLMATGQMGSWSAISQTIRGILSEEGIRGFWRGNLANCLKVGPAKGVKFAAYESILTAVCIDAKRPTAWENLYVSSGVAALSTVATYPLDTVKTQLAAGRKPAEIWALMHQCWKKGGLQGLFSGLSPSLISTVPFVGVNMATFMTGKRMYNEHMGKDTLQKPPTHVLFGLGFVATVASELVSYPLYVVKTQLQAGHGQKPLQIGRKILAERGPLGFYSGLSVATLKSTPAACITYAVYENAKALFAD